MLGEKEYRVAVQVCVDIGDENEMMKTMVRFFERLDPNFNKDKFFRLLEEETVNHEFHT